MNIFFISDTHFNHNNIIKYCNRDFNDVNSMNKYMINKWNSVVKENDLVYHLGDFSFNYSKEELIQLISKLNGDIVLILGNHDRKGIAFFKSVGFKEVYKKLIIDNFILTHKPMNYKQIPNGFINIHGHIHNSYSEEFNTNKHKNVSVERIDYTPVLIDDILSL